MIWVGWAVAALPLLLLAFSGVMKLAKPPAVVQGFIQSGYPASTLLPLGILELGCLVVYLIPRTAVLGAILTTGYLGGAVATNVRIGNPLWVMPVLVGVMLWGGLFFRDPRIRALIPLRKQGSR
jgi:hypothetical protein